MTWIFPSMNCTLRCTIQFLEHFITYKVNIVTVLKFEILNTDPQINNIITYITSLQGIPWTCHTFNTLRPRQNGRHFADDTFKRIFLNENVEILIKISLKFVHKGPINNTPALVQIMAWRRPGDKPLSEPMMVSLLTHICVTRPQWVNNNLIIIDKHTMMFVLGL